MIHDPMRNIVAPRRKARRVPQNGFEFLLKEVRRLGTMAEKECLGCSAQHFSATLEGSYGAIRSGCRE
jgi:hypothetical protein